MCLHIQNSQGKMQRFMSFMRNVGFCRASAGSNQTFFYYFFLSTAASVFAVQLSNRDLSIKLRDGSRALLAMRAFITDLSLSTLLASRLGSNCGIMDIPFLCLFSLEIFTHTKETKWNASPLSQPTLFAPVAPYGLSLLRWVFFFHPNTPKSTW